MRALAVVLIVFGGILATAWTRFAGLLLYIWFALFRPQEWAWGNVDNWRLSFVVGAVFVGSCFLSGVFPNIRHPLSIGALLFLFTGLLAQVHAVDQATGWLWLDSLSRMVIVSLLMVTLVTTSKRLMAVIAVSAGSLGFHTAKFGMSYLMLGGARFTSGIGGMFGDNNDFALAASRILFLLIAASQNVGPRLARWGFAAAVPLTALCVVGTFSRGAFLALGVGAVALALLQRRRLLVMTALGIVGSVMWLIVPVPSTYIERLSTVTTYEEVEDSSALGRLHFWRVAVEMARSNTFGVGLRNYEKNYNTYDYSGGQFGSDRSVHSSYFQVLAETGFPGLLVFLGLIAYAFRSAFRVRTRSRDPRLDPDTARLLFTSSNALIASMTAFAVGGAFLSQAFNDLNWFTFGLIAALDNLSAGLCHQAAAATNGQESSRERVPDFAATNGPRAPVPARFGVSRGSSL